MGRGRSALLVVGLLVASSTAVVGPSLAAGGTGGRGAQPAGRTASSAAIDRFEERFLTRRPDVGPTWVTDVGGLTTSQKLMLRTLQGIVNRSSARLYLRDPGDAGAQRWLDEYQAQGLVSVSGTTDLAGVLDRFAAEATGFVLASEAEPWTLDVAATVATAEGGIVATPAEVPALEARGLALLDDVRGRWTDAGTAYADVVAAYRSKLPYGGIAVLRPTDTLFDFTTQQGILTVFARPSSPEWPVVAGLIAGSTPGRAVYGYISDTGEEEGIAVATLSAAGLFLVPTDTTRNLSFHVAVGASLERTPAAQPSVVDVAPCRSEQVNVVVGVSDGDNLNVPVSHYSRPDRWRSPRRGDLPLGWSMGPSAAVLVPSIWDAYAREATPNDELVSMIGYGYAAPALLPDPVSFYRDSFELMDELGMRTFWSLGGGLESPGSSGWDQLDEAAGDGVPDGVLVGYGNGTGTGAVYASPAGRPAFTSGTSYADGPGDLVAQVRDLQARAPGDRPVVAFLSASQWTNPVTDLIDALAPLEAEGVRFLTPAEAAACAPPPEVAPPVVRTPGTCLPDAAGVRSGLALISDAIAAETERVPTPVGWTLAADAPAGVPAGASIERELTVTFDASALARAILDERARPIIEAGYGTELAATAWIGLDFDDVVVRIPVAPGTTAIGTPQVVSGAGAARWADDGTGMLEVVLDPLSADTRTPGPPVEVVVRWSVQTTYRPTSWTAPVTEGPASYDLRVALGIELLGLSVAGDVRAPWSCEPRPDALAVTQVGAATSDPEPPAPGSTTSTTTVDPPGAGPSTTTTTSTVPPPPAPTTAVPPSPRPGGVAPAEPAMPRPAVARYTG